MEAYSSDWQQDLADTLCLTICQGYHHCHISISILYKCFEIFGYFSWIFVFPFIFFECTYKIHKMGGYRAVFQLVSEQKIYCSHLLSHQSYHCQLERWCWQSTDTFLVQRFPKKGCRFMQSRPSLRGWTMQHRLLVNSPLIVDLLAVFL